MSDTPRNYVIEASDLLARWKHGEDVQDALAHQLRHTAAGLNTLREQLAAKTAALEKAQTKVNHLEKDRHDLFGALEGVVHSGTSFAFARGQDVLEAVTARAASTEEGAK